MSRRARGTGSSHERHSDDRAASVWFYYRLLVYLSTPSRSTVPCPCFIAPATSIYFGFGAFLVQPSPPSCSEPDQK